jgi:hypothetical protein
MELIKDIAAALRGVFARQPYASLPVENGLCAIVAHAMERADASGIGAGTLLALMVAALPPAGRDQFDRVLTQGDGVAGRTN